MAITVKHTKVSLIPDAGDDSLIEPSDWNDDHALTGLGTLAEQDADSVAITGGTMSGVAITGYIPTTEKGTALGVATLDASGKVPSSQIPMQGDLNYQGTWNASTNTPALVSSTGTKGYYYVVDVAGSTNLNGITDWNIGDWAIYNGTVWQKVDNTDAVSSVNGQVGTVVLTTTNIAEGTNQYFTTARARSSVSAGTGVSYNSTTGVITNSSPSLGGNVVGPSSATDNAVARYDSTTGKLLQNSVVTVGDTGAVSGVTTLAASTSVTTPSVQASNSGGLSLKNSAGTTQISMGGGGGDNASINVSTNINGINAQIDISPTGTGHVHIKPTGTGSLEIAPTNVGTIDNMTIGATTARAITGTTITATSFVGSGASLTNVVNSLTASTGISVSGSTGAVTVTNTAPDQVVSLTQGGATTITGTYPNFTISSVNTTYSQATSTTLGLIELASNTVQSVAPNAVTTTASRSYGLQVNASGQGVMNVPWTDTVYSLPTATTTILGGIELGSDTVQTVAPNAVTTTASRTYALQLNASGQAMVNVPWVNSGGTVTSVGGTGTVNGLTLTGTVTSSGNLTLGGTLNLSSPPAIGNTAPNTVAGTVIQATNGIVVNSNTVSASYTIPVGSSAMSAGPMTVASGQTVTVSSGSRWVVL